MLCYAMQCLAVGAHRQRELPSGYNSAGGLVGLGAHGVAGGPARVTAEAAHAVNEVERGGQAAARRALVH